ncbi:hypothetical protein [Oryzifoliimicrobium ureilyticus]|uniref:hypothetical protein n=1 Tax=Oryzifoliimicrobium ureilyticus TaxID=3113724 RepID=UPI003076660A
MAAIPQAIAIIRKKLSANLAFIVNRMGVFRDIGFENLFPEALPLTLSAKGGAIWVGVFMIPSWTTD